MQLNVDIADRRAELSRLQAREKRRGDLQKALSETAQQQVCVVECLLCVLCVIQ